MPIWVTGLAVLGIAVCSLVGPRYAHGDSLDDTFTNPGPGDVSTTAAAGDGRVSVEDSVRGEESEVLSRPVLDGLIANAGPVLTCGYTRSESEAIAGAMPDGQAVKCSQIRSVSFGVPSVGLADQQVVIDMSSPRPPRGRSPGTLPDRAEPRRPRHPAAANWRSSS